MNKLGQLETEPMEWLRAGNTMRSLLDSILLKAENRLGKNEAVIWFLGNIRKFTDTVRTNVPHYEKYLAWHKLAYSTVDYDRSPLIDFPEPYSFKGFIIRFQEEVEKMPSNKSV
jgi:hypothetical protein